MLTTDMFPPSVHTVENNLTCNWYDILAKQRDKL